jgi:hypothetical protein
MSKERELLKRAMVGDDDGDWFIGHTLYKEIQELLAQPEQSRFKEREVSGKIISTDDACNWNLTVGALKDCDHVYVNGIRYVEFQPEYKREPLTSKLISLGNNCHESFIKGVRFAEDMHGITGGGE